MELRELKETYRISTAWRDLGLPGKPGKSCCSPFPSEHKHGDASPSFSVFDDGRRAKDFATGEHFDVFDFVRKARGCNIADAIHFVEDRASISKPEPKWMPTGRSEVTTPPLRNGIEAELRELADQRGFNV